MNVLRLICADFMCFWFGCKLEKAIETVRDEFFKEVTCVCVRCGITQTFLHASVTFRFIAKPEGD